MPEALSAAAVTRLLGKILDDLYELGKGMFATQLGRLKREAVRRQLTKRAAACEKVKTIWQLDKEVRIPEFYYPSRVIFNATVTKEASSLSHFPRKGNFVIEGTIGQGKSIFLRYLCAEELRGKGTGRIPVFVELRQVEATGGLQGALLQTLDEYGFEVTANLWDFYSKSGKFVFFLDAFDELPTECIPGVMAELDHLSSKYPDLQVIITSRPDSEIQSSRHFRTYKLAPLRQEDHKPFLKKLLQNDSDVRHLLQAIEASPTRIASLLTTPLMLTLVAVVYRAEQAIPPELPEFFEMLFTTLFSRHDRTKGGFIRKRYSTLSERDTQILFEAFCFMSRYHAMSTSLTDADIDRALRDGSKYSGIPCDRDLFYQDITKIACLMQKEGARTNYVHKSIQEFFAASFVRRANDTFAARYYQSQRTNPRIWRQENAFLSQIDPYRYAKYFYLPEIATVENFYGVDFAKQTPKADERITAIATDGHIIDVTVEDDGRLDCTVSLHLPPEAGPLLRQLLSPIMFLCFEYIDGERGKSKDKILRLGKKVSDTDYEIPCRIFFEDHDLIPEVAKALNDHFNHLKYRYEYFKQVIILEESKSDLFKGGEAVVASKN